FDAELRHRLTVAGKTRERTFELHDQFAPELDYFAECIQTGREPEFSGEEGVADVRVLAAIRRAVADGTRLRLGPSRRSTRPTISQVMRRPSLPPAPMVHAASAALR